MSDGMECHHFSIPPLPPEPLWEVEVEENVAFDVTLRAKDEEQAKRRARAYFSLTPVSAREVEDE